MLDLTVIILTYNEELHIKRCVESVKNIAKSIWIVDSESTDSTREIAKDSGAKVLMHAWPGNQAKQFNWALDNIDIETEWVLRLDADEYLMPNLIHELTHKLPTMPETISGITFNRRFIFLGRWMKSIYPIKLLRCFRAGKALSEDRWMDEHIRILQGEVIDFQGDFCDENLNDLSWYCQKHINYAIREAVELLDVELGIVKSNRYSELGVLNKQAQSKRKTKHKYVSAPLFVRSFMYFLYRYFIKLGVLDGKEGFLFCFIQGWWYRTLVDAKIYEIKKSCGTDIQKIQKMLLTQYNIDLSK